MMYPYNFFMYPYFPTNCDKPPTIYALLQSIVNFGKEDKTKIKNLAKEGHSKVFDFEYPLSDTINKDDFEINILNHFLKRRIGFETMTDFQIHLCSKLNEIMPMYNKILDAMENWNIFASEKITHELTSTRKIDSKNQNSSTTNNEVSSESTTSDDNISDRRFSDMPENEITDVQDGTYMSKYSYDTDNRDISEESNSSGSSETNQSGTNNTNDDNYLHEETIKSKSNPELMIQYMEKIANIYTLIYKDLDCLFYQLV